MTAVHDKPFDSTCRSWAMVSRFGLVRGTTSSTSGVEVSMPYSEGMKRFTPAWAAAWTMEVWIWVERVAIAETIASWPLNA